MAAATDAPRVRLAITAPQRSARVRTLALAALAGGTLTVVLVIVAVAASGWPVWLSAVASVFTLAVTVAAVRGALVLRSLQPREDTADAVCSDGSPCGVVGSGSACGAGGCHLAAGGRHDGPAAVN